MSKIDLEDSATTILLKMSGGNPGAMGVLATVLKDGEKIDPQDFAGGLGAILHLDSMGIYGSDIWLLYKDVCGQSVVAFIAAIRAVQLGLRTREQLKHAIANRGDGWHPWGVLKEVKEQLSEFDNHVGQPFEQKA